ncbi:membrane metallo-endopeptidase-like 1 [Microplitis mediator]|uniref:membrane metallo-endopeptidase-like 1 n=1 Tax=Microplitis mediator TaxID=375433 RepID=UPI002553C125|nr:membrane metallo-endopeptidase-like 1 [Microplitis mediator]
MKFKIILFCLTASTFGNTISPWKSHDSHKDAGWFLDADKDTIEVREISVCNTPECITFANDLLSSMNKSADPCQNFYEHTCGSFLKSHPLPAYSGIWSRLLMFQEWVYERLKVILETPAVPDDILPVRQAKKWYQSCMDSETLEKRGLDPIESVLMQVGGWPMTIDAEEWDETEHPWQRIEQHYFEITGSYIFYKFTPVWSNTSLIKVEKGDLPLLNKLPFEFKNYEGDEYDNYKAFISAVALLFVQYNSANVSIDKIFEDVSDLIEFEKQLSLIANEVGEDAEIVSSMAEFQAWYDENTTDQGNKVTVKKLVRRLLETVNHDPESIKYLSAASMAYFVKLHELMNKTPKRTIINYIHWDFVCEMLSSTTEEMRDAFFDLKSKEIGVTAREPRWVECAKEIKMLKANGYAFAEKYFSKDVDTNVRSMVDNVGEEMKIQIKGSDWLDEATKKIVTDKIDDMGSFVGTPDWYKNRTYVLNSYKGLVISNNHFDNVLSYKKYEMREKLRKALSGKQPEEGDAEVDILEVNAFYDPYSNTIIIPVAFLQPPFFTSSLPNNVNYGMIGSVIGHELGHAYDINGLKIGLEQKHLKLSTEIADMYKQRAGCFIDQFKEYFREPKPHDGTASEAKEEKLSRQTQGENMADTTGLNAVFDAWKRMKATKGSDSRLPGFEKYSDEQMFFIGFGALWCTEATEEYAEAIKDQDEHSPANLRVLGAISNSEEFARAFNCPKGSTMNPEKKCDIW